MANGNAYGRSSLFRLNTRRFPTLFVIRVREPKDLVRIGSDEGNDPPESSDRGHNRIGKTLITNEVGIS